MVTHDPRIAAHAHRIVFMQDGRIVDDRKITDADEARSVIEAVGLM
jgi:ABC-type lipoprotein export system ATPase subunit